jgi:hypothetical protein
VWGGAIRYLKTDDLETKAKQIDDIFLQEEQNQKQVDRELSLLKEDMFRESQVSQGGRSIACSQSTLWGTLGRAEHYPRIPCSARRRGLCSGPYL